MASTVGTSLSFSCEDSSMAIVGCENGCLLKCSIQTDTVTSQDSHLGQLLATNLVKNVLVWEENADHQQQ